MTASCRSEDIKARVTMEQAARHYGFEPNRAGYIRCPFHREKTASLKIYPGQGGWHCFGCGAGGSVIDFVMALYGISFPQALVRLSADFGLGLEGRRAPRHEAALLVRRRRQEQEERERQAAEYREKAAEYRYWREAAEVFAPQVASGALHPLYVQAVKRLPVLAYWLDEHLGAGK